MQYHNGTDQSLVCPACRNILVSISDNLLCEHCHIRYPVIANIPSFAIDHISCSTGFDKDTFLFLRKMEKSHFWHLGRKEILYEAILSSMGKSSGKRMLELGCGNGSILRHLKENGIEIEGSDVSIDCLRNCRETLDIPLYHIDSSRTPFPDESFDAIGAFDVLEHLDDPRTLLNEARRICKPGGTLIVSVPAKRYLFSYFDELSGHKRRYEKDDLENLIRGCGFTVVRSTFFMTFLLPVLWVVRRLSGRRGGPVSRDLDRAETKTLPVINDLCLAIIRLEKRLMRRHDLPFGTSLLCVARR